MIIADINDARDGDWIKGEFEAEPYEADERWVKFEGELYFDFQNDPHVGNTWLAKSREGGVLRQGIRIHSIERPDPILPTELRSVITDVTTLDAEREHWIGILTMGGWLLSGDERPYPPEEIVSFTPAKVVPA